jgi:heme/copper-type cytochrome/quinol oxidase subunit 2
MFELLAGYGLQILAIVLIVVFLLITFVWAIRQSPKKVNYTDEQKIRDIYISIMKENDD